MTRLGIKIRRIYAVQKQINTENAILTLLHCPYQHPNRPRIFFRFLFTILNIKFSTENTFWITFFVTRWDRRPIVLFRWSQQLITCTHTQTDRSPLRKKISGTIKKTKQKNKKQHTYSIKNTYEPFTQSSMTERKHLSLFAIFLCGLECENISVKLGTKTSVNL